jgi:RsiW-degrading membrane proteinase PrsW (M82 family)
MAEIEICCVCHRPVTGQVYRLGGRDYDEAHYFKVSKENPAAARPIFISVAILTLITALLYLIFDTLQQPDPLLTGPLLRVAGSLLALLPALLWLFLFYRLDHLEPEPKRYVIGVFLLTALLAAGITQPLIARIFFLEDWSAQNLWIRLAGAILCFGIVQEFLKYACVRYTVYQSEEFDERVDGIIYSAAAGLGYATAINLDYLFSISSLAVGAGVIRFTIHSLAHASFAGITGYFLGSAKFDQKSRWWLPLGLLLAALANGLISTLLESVGLMHGPRSGGINHWLRLVTAAMFAFVIYAAVFAAVRNLNKKTLAHPS